MRDHPHYDDDAIFNPETHHEKSDVSVRALLVFIAIFVAFGMVTHLALWLLYKGFVRVEQKRQLGAATAMEKPADMAVPKNQPLLQPFPRREGGQELPPNRNTPVTDLADMRKAEDDALSTYGWIDQQKGIVRIPIGDAKRMVLQRGLPVQAVTAPPSAVPGASSPAVTNTGGSP